MKKKRAIVCCLLVIICMKSLVAYAGSGTLNIQVEGKGVLAEVYQVGTKKADGSIRLKKEYGIVWQASNAQGIKEIIDKLDECMTEEAKITGVSDTDGTINISGLNEGVYYIRFSGGEYEREYVSTLVQIPDYYQEIYPKYEETEEMNRTEIAQTGDQNKREIYLILCVTSFVVFVLGTRNYKKYLGGKND